ncbi:hypothetical protein ACIQCN_15030 [Pseudarthrobacter sp. NPDC092424]|uniref:hypothetical protein n=1 Tax=Pseudarthrobacter sp. NPDC092424 TaxID=3364415 RepID=UPI0038170696
MRRPTVSPLRRLRSLRSLFVCVLAALLLTGTATYSHGTRYDLPGNNLPAAAAGTSADEPGASSDPEELSDDSERRFAPRGEPAPLRTGVVDPPQLLHRLPGDAVLSTGPPAQPESHALTLAELSISRT